MIVWVFFCLLLIEDMSCLKILLKLLGCVVVVLFVGNVMLGSLIGLVGVLFGVRFGSLLSSGFWRVLMELMSDMVGKWVGVMWCENGVVGSG